MKNDLTNTEEALLGDKGFLAQLEKGCATKQHECQLFCSMVKVFCNIQELAIVIEQCQVNSSYPSIRFKLRVSEVERLTGCKVERLKG